MFTISKFITGHRFQAALLRNLLLIVVLSVMSAVTGGAQSYAEDNGKQFVRTDLVSNVIGRASYADSSLINPWGITRSPYGPWWVVNGGKGRATLYTGDGAPYPALSPLVVAIPVNPGGIENHSAPAGIVYNASDDFHLAPSEPAWFVFATRDGTIEGWAPGVDRYEAVLMADNSPDAVYTGAAIVGSRLYVANFRQGRIEVFDDGFDPMTLEGTAFADPLIPAGFSPFNVQSIGGKVYAAFAQPDTDGRIAVSGEGLGFVDVFDPEGNPVSRLEQGPWMNAPWGIAPAPAQFGDYGSSVLIGNSGSGRIAAFDRETGAFKGYLMDQQGTPISVPGLRGLGFGNGGAAGPENTLFFSAGPDGGRQGLLGAITPGKGQGEIKAGQSGFYSP